MAKQNDQKLKSWIEKREREIVNCGMEEFLVIVLDLAQKFGESKPSNPSVMDESQKERDEFENSLKADIVSFEIFCFLLHEINFWLFTKKPEFGLIAERLHISAAFLFSDIFKIDAKRVHAMLKERLELYGQIVREGKAEKLLYYLEKLIWFALTKEKTEPANLPDMKGLDIIYTLNAMETFLVRVSVSTFYIHLVPNIRENLNRFCMGIEDEFGAGNPKAIEWIGTNGLKK